MSKPSHKYIGSDRYDMTVMQVIERDHMKRPVLLRVLHDEQTVDLEELSKGVPEGQPVADFIIVYANRKTWTGTRTLG